MAPGDVFVIETPGGGGYGAAGGCPRPLRPSAIQTAMKGPILVTGFEPFGGEPSTPPGWWRRRWTGSASRACRCMRCACPACLAIAAVLQAAAVAAQAGRGAGLGLAAGRGDLSLERVAINVDDARIPDNAGAQPVDEPVIAGAPAAYFSRLPIKAIVAALREAGLPASVSQSAGTFVCNHVFFGLMHTCGAAAACERASCTCRCCPNRRRASGQPSLPLAAGAGLALALHTP
jgi:pyroglutamyl-peptidase